MMPLGLLKRRIVYSSCLTSVFQMGGVQLSAYYLPLWFQVIKGASPSMSGVYFMGTVGPQIVVALFSGALSMSFLSYLLQYELTLPSFKVWILHPMGHRRKPIFNNWIGTSE